MKRARYPIEVYFLLIPGLIIFFADIILNSILDFPFHAEIISKIPSVLKTGGKGFGTGSVIILLVLAMYVIFAPNRKGIPDEKKEKGRGVFYVVRSFFVLAMVVAVALWAVDICYFAFVPKRSCLVRDSGKSSSYKFGI